MLINVRCVNVSIKMFCFLTGGGRGQFEEDAADGASYSQWDIQR